MSAPAGWYPDPSDASRQRWWDGAQWAAAAPSQYAPAPSAFAPPAPVQVETGTVWVWLAVVASIVPFFVLFFIDWGGYLDAIVAAGNGYSSGSELVRWQLQTLAVSALSWIAIAAYIVFAWLDWRELRRRGVAAPFHWAWSFFALLSAGLAVYMIGRAVVLRRRTVAGGWPPLWVWVGATALGYVATIVWFIWFFGTFFERLAVYSGA